MKKYILSNALSIFLIFSTNIILQAQQVRTPNEEREVGYADFTVNNIWLARHHYPTIAGDNLVVSVKEQAFDKDDIDFKNRILSNTVFQGRFTTHASNMASLIAGAGNSSPLSQGVAWKALLTSADFSNLTADNTQWLINNKISVQNHSYGVGVENFYGDESKAYDQQVLDIGYIMHIFSSGNSGNLTITQGNYKNIPNFANLTGQFKNAKNTLSIGAVDKYLNVSPLSSRGPANDGRIKPELVAFGDGGTSESAAFVSGISLLLQQLYAQKNNNQLPNAHLLKAILCNTAQDVGKEGIDFLAGFGNADTYRALKTIENNYYIENNITHQSTKNFTIQIPANTAEVKITIAWNDIPNPSLTNDLDLSLYHAASNTTWLPWVLNHYPHPDSLNQLPKRKVDHINNIEQISIKNPIAGEYTIKVHGYQIGNNAAQNFSIAYDFHSKELLWAYPHPNTQLFTNEENIIRWQNNTDNTTGDLYFKSAQQPQWQLIEAQIPLNKNFFAWKPSENHTQAQFKIESNSQSYQSPTCHILPKTDFDLGFNCSESLMFSWQKMPFIQNYQLFALGNTYLEKIATTNDTIIILPKTQYTRFAVAPIIDNATLPYSISIDYNSQEIDCYVKNFIVEKLINDTITLFAELNTLYGVNNIELQRLNNGAFNTIQSITNLKKELTLTDNQPNPNQNQYRLKINSSITGISYSRVEVAYFSTEDNIYLYPNPINQGEMLNIVLFEDTLADKNAEAININAQTTFQLEINEGAIKTINTRQLPKGLYFIRFRNNKGRLIQQKIMIN
ncbi:MAG: T9SS C-terminal target domain-containing protein [Cytophagales bacterium]|nr:MAG: T9SS C-terminal target domain-containing protein [Cytophagales bacterium]